VVVGGVGVVPPVEFCAIRNEAERAAMVKVLKMQFFICVNYPSKKIQLFIALDGAAAQPGTSSG
jgi:hypothetical protein